MFHNVIVTNTILVAVTFSINVKSEMRVRVIGRIEEQTRRQSTRNACAIVTPFSLLTVSHEARKKCHIRQFRTILDVCRPGSHARTARDTRDRSSVRIERGNFDIISPSSTRSTAVSRPRPRGRSRWAAVASGRIGFRRSPLPLPAGVPRNRQRGAQWTVRILKICVKNRIFRVKHFFENIFHLNCIFFESMFSLNHILSGTYFHDLNNSETHLTEKNHILSERYFVGNGFAGNVFL